MATERLGLSDVVLPDPSRGGPDLSTKDGTVVIEARMLASTEAANPSQLATTLQEQLNQMTGRLNSDFARYPPGSRGYAILSYADNSGAIHTIVIEVLKS